MGDHIDTSETSHTPRGARAAPRPGRRPPEPVRVLSTGFRSFDKALGGGYAMGRVVELYGDGGAIRRVAKSALLHVARTGGHGAVVHFRHPDLWPALDVEHPPLVSRPDDASLGVEIVETLVRTGVVSLLVLDAFEDLRFPSLAGGISEARFRNAVLNTLTGIAARTGTTLLTLRRGPERVVELAAHAYQRVEARYRGGEGRIELKAIQNPLGPRFQTTMVP